MMKKIVILLSTLSLAIVLTLWFIDPPVDDRQQIRKLPPGYQPFAVYEPYQGPHPSRLQRPADPFNYPVQPGASGPVSPLFAGPLLYPFLCRSLEAEPSLGQPLVDNQQGVGTPVYGVDKYGEPGDRIVGYSRDCSLPTTVRYLYKPRASETFKPLAEADGDIDEAEVDGRQVPFVVRVEVGTIHRHPYVLLALKGEQETENRVDPGNWNGKLIYQFRGGVGIGKRQGRLVLEKLLERRWPELARGYAVIHSTANQTSNHYNLWLAEDTALRVKRQFVSLYGEPAYTVGIGGSGGGLQQYLLAQNNPQLIDAAIAQYSFPDMVTQTNYVLDCELLEHYFDVTARDNPKWSDWSNRRYVEGLNAKDWGFNKFNYIKLAADLVSFKSPHFNVGSSECANAWRGLSPLILNPRYPQLPHKISGDIQAQTQLTYWDDLKYFYGTDEMGHARISWGNRGVQYGLQALKDGHISVDEFLHLNRFVGSWKSPQQMGNEHFWFLGRDPDTAADRFDLWSSHNMQLSPDGVAPAPRRIADEQAIAAAFRSGQVFLGRINIPLIDVRHYLEDSLDMHHSVASFQARARMIAANGHARNQIIWMSRKPHLPNALAFDTIDAWMNNIKQHPERSAADNKPAPAQDTCFDKHGSILAQGDDVWDGSWNGKAAGACSKIYPPFSTSRLVAGENIRGDYFSCALQSVQQALQNELYRPIDMRPYRAQLEQIFPDGVCDFSRPDPARPQQL